MRKIDDYAELERLICAQMKRGMSTNAFYSREDFERAISAGSLRAESWAGGLALAFDRGDYDRLSFWMTDTLAPIGITLPRRTVLEIAARPKDENLWAADRAWERFGFEPLFDRVRLSHPAWEAPEAPLDAAGPDDMDAVSALLRANFHPLGGCIPTPDELMRELSEGRFLCIRDEEGAPAAILHYSEERRAANIRHLCVRDDFRRRGCAKTLISAFAFRTGGKRATVWTGADNMPAIRLYRSCGYETDGRTSRVRLYNI